MAEPRYFGTRTAALDYAPDDGEPFTVIDVMAIPKRRRLDVSGQLDKLIIAMRRYGILRTPK